MVSSAAGKPPLLEALAVSALQFFNPYAETKQTENRLPHWEQRAVYFVTFRLADAVPLDLLQQWERERETWIQLHPEPWSFEIEQEYHRRFSGTIERWLDAGQGSCVLRQSECAKLLSETLGHFDGDRVILISSVVMPNHVHALFILNPEYSLEKLLRSWKTFSARQINAILQRSGNVWQKDYFDRLVRDEKHFANCVRYIRRNPEKARLTKDEYVIYESEVAKHVEYQGAAVSRPPFMVGSATGRAPLLDV
jgi:REP-associated tyrosine transposase